MGFILLMWPYLVRLLSVEGESFLHTRDIERRGCTGRCCAAGSRLRVLHGMAREVLISNPDEVIAYLSLFPVPSAVVRLVRKIEHINIRGRYFYIDFEYVSLKISEKINHQSRDSLSNLQFAA